MASDSDRAGYWDSRILDWEASRYDGRWSPRLGPVEWLAGLASGPTRLRQRLGVELLAPFLVGRGVTEVGCGSGRLARRFIEAGASAYLGLDHSREAIEEARRSRAGPGITFEVRPAAELRTGAGIVVSLGVLDWVPDGELEALFRRQGREDFLHTFSERRASMVQVLHRALRKADSLLRPRAVRPRFLELERLCSFLPDSPSRELFVLRDRRLRYAVFLSSLPIRGGERLRWPN